jgi:hypothetical protein
MSLYFQILSSTTKFFGHCPENIWAAIKFFQSLDQWPVLIEQFKISGRPPQKKLGRPKKNWLLFSVATISNSKFIVAQVNGQNLAIEFFRHSLKKFGKQPNFFLVVGSIAIVTYLSNSN